jgi:hypothetical protein
VSSSYIREVCANPEIVQLPSTPKEIRLTRLEFQENEEVLHFTCNGKLNGANRLTIDIKARDKNIGKFIRQWFKVCKKFTIYKKFLAISYASKPHFFSWKV